MDYSIRIGGEAGQGLQTVGEALTLVFSRSGFHVFSHQDYMSRVRGGHNFYQIRLADEPVTASRDRVDILVSLDRNTIDFHRRYLGENGVILYDSKSVENELDGGHFFGMPLADIAKEVGGSKIMVNSVATGAVLGLLDLELDLFYEIIEESLKKKSREIIEGNIKAAEAGRNFLRDRFSRMDDFKTPAANRERRLLRIKGIQAIGAGALASGCKFYSAYPMTPSTGILTYLAGKAAEHHLVVEQAEDEIAAINMALGASYGGVRAMTGTSGGGFALMTEGVSLAAITETPLVVAEMQRPGPATGLPTRTEQSDLLFVVHGGHGEFPRVVFTPGTPEQAFNLTGKAFDLAEKYQIPVFIQGDQYLADCEWTYQDFDLSRIRYQDYRLRGDELKGRSSYKRYEDTDSGISPLAVPGASQHLVVVDSDEHDEDGHIIEDAETRNMMVRKRLHKKMAALRGEIDPPTLYGNDRPRAVLLCYGSTYGVVREAVDDLLGEYPVAMLHFSEVYPMPLPEKFDYPDLLETAALTIAVELNATGQLTRLLREETGCEVDILVNRYDGRPFTLEPLIDELREHLQKMESGGDS